jgi:hypothetical protein
MRYMENVISAEVRPQVRKDTKPHHKVKSRFNRPKHSTKRKAVKREAAKASKAKKAAVKKTAKPAAHKATKA